ncbi:MULTISPECIES: flagellar assembly protein FliH [unclassified Variovorax]|uniref:flagellar assembly protein FliH n=1 Tax=unclassified Variovorax TaxID=663243 RepID=UPI00076C0043|nr:MULTISPECIES: flagellar assembly protein FliH [unclassified Variovorax]KWT95992.1 Flagellar assembly protein FliH [Variovorax sp. WDL1]PNG46937.1 Flagellar assembly protein FliH [Variovorax sp. B2]PNG48412.1 Flagellar assembly protein FliH [Variovorax sp. B4]VTV14775.1 Flagellar assembly protein FliH [Variovorax sp. WDL1]
MTSSKQTAAAPASRARLAAAYAPARPAAAPQAAKPSLSAWQRWEMGTLENEDAAHGNVQALVVPRVDPEVLARDNELSRLRLQARAEGRTEGHREGLAKGRAEGHAEGLAAGLAAASAHAEQLRALAATLPAALRRAESELADAILTLAMDVARQVVHRTLRAEPEWVLPLVQDLLHAEPALQGEPRLLLHPDDVALVKNSLGNELQIAGWQVRPDDTLARGGCRVQSASGEMDASLETRWKSVTAALSRDIDAAEL